MRGCPGVDQVRLPGAVPGDSVRDHRVITADIELLDVAPAGILDPGVDVDVASPSIRATIYLKYAVARRGVSRLVHSELVRIGEQGIESGQPVFVSEGLVGDQPLHSRSGHLPAQAGDVFTHQRAIGHRSGQELVVVREPRVDPEVELTVGHRHEGVGRRQLKIRGVAHPIPKLLQQSSVDSSLQITGRPVSPRHRHRNPRPGAFASLFQRHLSLFCGHLSLFCGLLSLFKPHLSLFCGLLSLFQRRLSLFATFLGRRFSFRQRGLGRLQLSFGFAQSGVSCLFRCLGCLLGAGVDDGDGRLRLGRGLWFVVPAGHSHQCEHRQHR